MKAQMLFPETEAVDRLVFRISAFNSRANTGEVARRLQELKC